jgi:pSer/pThr/pTyr-binding forkhead associated (FHA) protein
VVDAPGVSRHHARIVVTEAQVTLEDLGSNNGTYLGGRRVEAPAILSDGDTFRLGRHALAYRSAPVEAATATDVDEE